MLSIGTSSDLAGIMRDQEIYCEIKSCTYKIVCNCVRLTGISSDVLMLKAEFSLDAGYLLRGKKAVEY